MECYHALFFTRSFVAMACEYIYIYIYNVYVVYVSEYTVLYRETAMQLGINVYFLGFVDCKQVE